MKKFLIRLFLIGTYCSFLHKPVSAIPPLVAGDVSTADIGSMEFFLGNRYQKTGEIERQIPFSELVLGVSNRQELTFEIPYLSISPSQGNSQSGFGDAVMGTKVAFFRETERRPGLALSWEAKLKNASQGSGLGSGVMEYDLRWRAQKTWGWFTGLWNLGYTFVGEPTINGIRQDRRDVWFWAFAQEHKIAPKTKLLSEIYWKNSDTPGESARFAGDVGFKHSLLSWLQVQAAIGKSLRDRNLGGPKLRIYAGLKLEFPVFSRGRRS